MKLSEIVPEVITLARAANQARTAEGPDDDSPLVRLQTTEECRLREFLEAQAPAVVFLLTAIMYLGRGDFDAKDLLDQYIEISVSFGNPKLAARQMLVKMPLPEYLEEGWHQLAQAGVDIDGLLPT